jgi:hypothetical protein
MKKYPPTTPDNINPYEAMDFLRDNAGEAGRLKGQVYILTEMRKTVKARLMNLAIEAKTEAAKERFADSHEELEKHINKTGEAISEFETLRLLISAAEAKLEAWRSLEASARNEIRLSQ